MTHPNLDIIHKFFEAYGQRDESALRQVLAEHVTWTFPGHHPLGGTRAGIDQVIAFFDAMGSVMGKSNVQAESLVTGANDDYAAECQHVRTNRGDGHNLDQYWCVLWKFEDGKITEGRHLAGDQHAVDEFFKQVLT